MRKATLDKDQVHKARILFDVAIKKMVASQIPYSDVNNEVYYLLDCMGYFEKIDRERRLKYLDQGKLQLLSLANVTKDLSLRGQLMRACSDIHYPNGPSHWVQVSARRCMLVDYLQKVIAKGDEYITTFTIDLDVRIREYLDKLF